MEQLKKAGSLPVEDELPVVALADVCKEVLHPILRHIYPVKRDISGEYFFLFRGRGTETKTAPVALLSMPSFRDPWTIWRIVK